jgi:ABC-type lipoprotein release transport system permease subunit
MGYDAEARKRKGFAGLLGTDPSFETEHVLTLNVTTSPTRSRSSQRRRAASLALMLVAGLAATLVPATRATRVNPLIAIRAD